MAADLHYFADGEARSQGAFRARRDRWLAPVLRILPAAITPELVTATSALLLIGFVLYVTTHPLAAFGFLAGHVLLDAVDGPLARLRGRAHAGGSLLDILNDHSGMAIVSIALIYHGLAEPTIAAAYIYAYTVLVALIIARNALGVPPRFTVRSKYVLYALYGLWATTNIPLFTALMSLMIPICLMLIAIDVRVLYRALGERSAA